MKGSKQRVKGLMSFPLSWEWWFLLTKAFVSSGILLIYLCSWYKSWQACNRHGIMYSRFWSVSCVCRNVYFVSCDSLCSFWEKLVPSVYCVVGECPCAMGVVVSRKAGFGRWLCYWLEGLWALLEGLANLVWDFFSRTE